MSLTQTPALFTAERVSVYRGVDGLVGALGRIPETHEVRDERGELVARVNRVRPGPKLWRALKHVVGFVFELFRPLHKYEVVDPDGTLLLEIRTDATDADIRTPDGAYVGSMNTRRVSQKVNRLRCELFVGDADRRSHLRRIAPDAEFEGEGPKPAFSHTIRDEHNTRNLARLEDDGQRHLTLDLRLPMEEPLRKLLVGCVLAAVDIRWLQVPSAIERSP